MVLASFWRDMWRLKRHDPSSREMTASQVSDGPGFFFSYAKEVIQVVLVGEDCEGGDCLGPTLGVRSERDGDTLEGGEGVRFVGIT